MAGTSTRTTGLASAALAARAKSRDHTGSLNNALPAASATVKTLSASSTLPLARRGSQSRAVN